MADEAKHVLLREDLVRAFDEDEVLAEIEAMDREWAGDWREHIPYAAARKYREDLETCATYEGHVDECVYCQRMVDALNPAEDVFRDLQELRRKLGVGRLVPGVENEAKSAADWGGTRKLIGDALGEVLPSVDQLVVLEAREEPSAKFKAARIYLETKHAQQAYKRIGEGLALANVDRTVIECVNVAARAGASTVAAESLANVAHEMSKLLERGFVAEKEQLRLVEVLAQLGQHWIAMDSLWAVLIRRGASMVAEALEDAKLVGAFRGEHGSMVRTVTPEMVPARRATGE